MGMGTGTNEGWYFKRLADVTDAKGGPYSWPDLAAFAQQGLFGPDDLVWHASLPDWTAAGAVPGLFSAPQPAAAPQPATALQTAAGTPRGGRTGLVVGAVALLVVVVVALGIGAWWFLGRDGGGIAGGPDLGVAEVTLPDRAKLIQTAEWGEVPANQIGVTLNDGEKRKAAEKLAESLGGAVVGEIEFVNTYQIEFPGVTEADLKAALDRAAGDEAVAAAFPNQQTELDAEIWGVRQSPYDDPVYGGGAGDGYRAIGVNRAWTLIRGAGVDLSKVHVGVVDDGIYKSGEGRESEFGGDVEVDYPDPDAGQLASPEVWDDGTTNPAGSHGTGVSTIIGADPGNGGATGVAGPLGKNLKISMINHFAGKYGDTSATPDPADPTKYVAADGNSYSMGSLVALKKQIEAGATVINCSWGAVNAHPGTVAVYKKFFEKMAADHPKVLFVCSGGNNGRQLDGTKRFPSGLSLPNMITVGALDNDGKTATYASKASANYEVTLGAPGTGAVVGIKPEGGVEQQDGSSFAAPHVTAAAAILKSLNPKLEAGDIKRILTETARTSVDSPQPDGTVKTQAVNANVGGRILALDAAVLKVINDLRAEKQLPPLDDKLLEKMGVIDAVATTGEPGEYAVKGIIEAAGEKGTDVSIGVTGEGYAIGGKTTQSLAGVGEVSWNVTLPKDEGVITVRRLDNDAASVITIERFNINGPWSGSFTITDVQITDEEAAKQEGCSLGLISELKGKAAPMTMDITVDDGGQGSGEGVIDFASLMGEGEAEAQRYGVAFTGNTITYSVEEGGGINMSAAVRREGENLVQNGTFSASGPGFKMTAVFTLSKPDTTQ